MLHRPFCSCSVLRRGEKASGDKPGFRDGGLLPPQPGRLAHRPRSGLQAGCQAAGSDRDPVSWPAEPCDLRDIGNCCGKAFPVHADGTSSVAPSARLNTAQATSAATLCLLKPPLPEEIRAGWVSGSLLGGGSAPPLGAQTSPWIKRLWRLGRLPIANPASELATGNLFLNRIARAPSPNSVGYIDATSTWNMCRARGFICLHSLRFQARS